MENETVMNQTLRTRIKLPCTIDVQKIVFLHFNLGTQNSPRYGGVPNKTVNRGFTLFFTKPLKKMRVCNLTTPHEDRRPPLDSTLNTSYNSVLKIYKTN